MTIGGQIHLHALSAHAPLTLPPVIFLSFCQTSSFPQSGNFVSAVPVEIWPTPSARSQRDETQNARQNATRNPRWWLGFNKLQIKLQPKSQFECVLQNVRNSNSSKISIRICTARY